MASTVTFIIMRGRRKNGNNILFYVYRWKRKRWANKKESFIYITIIILIIRCVSVSMQKNGDFPISFESVADVTLSTYIILVFSLHTHVSFILWVEYSLYTLISNTLHASLAFILFFFCHALFCNWSWNHDHQHRRHRMSHRLQTRSLNGKSDGAFSRCLINHMYIYLRYAKHVLCLCYTSFIIIVIIFFLLAAVVVIYVCCMLCVASVTARFPLNSVDFT